MNMTSLCPIHEERTCYAQKAAQIAPSIFTGSPGKDFVKRGIKKPSFNLSFKKKTVRRHPTLVRSTITQRKKNPLKEINI